MCLILDQFLWGHSSRVCDISCFIFFLQKLILVNAVMFISSRQENHRKTSARRLLLIIFDSVIAYRDISGTTKPIDVNSTLCAATLTLRIIKRVSKKGVMITATNNQF